jgi:hypothetical protein
VTVFDLTHLAFMIAQYSIMNLAEKSHTHSASVLVYDVREDLWLAHHTRHIAFEWWTPFYHDLIKFDQEYLIPTSHRRTLLDNLRTID